MKLATLKNGTRDGQLVVVSKDNARYLEASSVAPTLQSALDRWDECEPKLKEIYKNLESQKSLGKPAIDQSQFAAPLPRAYEWIDGSAYINHVVLVRKARNAEPPKTLRTDPLIYQGGSSVMLGARDPIYLADESWGCDFESEVADVVGMIPFHSIPFHSIPFHSIPFHSIPFHSIPFHSIPFHSIPFHSIPFQGTKKQDASKYIKLIMIVNDVSLRNLIPAELEKGFGFFQSKPASAFAPFAITPDELGDAWKDGRVHLPLVTHYNGKKFGDPNAGPEMHFSFLDLIEHICKTRSYTAGTILGSGTVSNEDRARGSSCLAEVRMLETIDQGKPTTPFMKAGETIEIEMFDSKGASLFGKILQKVTASR